MEDNGHVQGWISRGQVLIKILELIRKWAWLILAFCVVGLLALMYQSCTVDATAEYYKGKYAAEMELRAAENDIHAKHIEELGIEKEVLDMEINQLKEENAAIDNDRRVTKKKLADVLAEEPIQPELEEEPLVINLRQQVRLLTFVLEGAEKELENKDKIIFNLTEKYNAQVGISDSYRAMYENEKELHRLAIDRLKIADRRIASLRFTGNAKNVLVVVAGGAIAYLLLK